MAQPTTVIALRRFLGLTRYYRKFNKDYGKIIALLTDMLEKNNSMCCHKAENAFMKLKLVMVQGLILGLPDFTKIFIIDVMLLTRDNTVLT